MSKASQLSNTMLRHDVAAQASDSLTLLRTSNPNLKLIFVPSLSVEVLILWLLQAWYLLISQQVALRLSDRIEQSPCSPCLSVKTVTSTAGASLQMFWIFCLSCYLSLSVNGVFELHHLCFFSVYPLPGLHGGSGRPGNTWKLLDVLLDPYSLYYFIILNVQTVIRLCWFIYCMFVHPGTEIPPLLLLVFKGEFFLIWLGGLRIEGVMKLYKWTI